MHMQLHLGLDLNAQVTGLPAAASTSLFPPGSTLQSSSTPPDIFRGLSASAARQPTFVPLPSHTTATFLPSAPNPAAAVSTFGQPSLFGAPASTAAGLGQAGSLFGLTPGSSAPVFPALSIGVSPAPMAPRGHDDEARVPSAPFPSTPASFLPRAPGPATGAALPAPLMPPGALVAARTAAATCDAAVQTSPRLNATSEATSSALIATRGAQATAPAAHTPAGALAGDSGLRAVDSGGGSVTASEAPGRRVLQVDLLTLSPATPVAPAPVSGEPVHPQRVPPLVQQLERAVAALPASKPAEATLEGALPS